MILIGLLTSCARYGAHLEREGLDATAAAAIARRPTRQRQGRGSFNLEPATGKRKPREVERPAPTGQAGALAETKKDALAGFDSFVETWGVKYEPATSRRR